MAVARTPFDIAKQLAYRSGFTVARQSQADAQDAFFALIRPVETEHELIRIGGDGDGGYLVPDDLDGVAACFSPGVDVTATFEADMIARGMRCFQADASVASSPLDSPLVDFEKKFLGIAPDAQTVTLDDWVAAKLPDGNGDLILQMDIEGAEWVTLAAARNETLLRFRIMVIELHYLDRIFDPFGSAIINAVLGRLLRHFDVVHAHPNNVVPAIGGKRGLTVTPLLEVTLLRKDRSRRRMPATRFPHPLDHDNVPHMPSVALPSSMYGSY